MFLIISTDNHQTLSCIDRDAFDNFQPPRTCGHARQGSDPKSLSQPSEKGNQAENHSKGDNEAKIIGRSDLHRSLRSSSLLVGSTDGSALIG